jgi:CRISPR system Cascade subunit CasA
MSAGVSVFNLVRDPFFPVVTVSGARQWLAFPDLGKEAGDYPVAFDWPRSDLNIATFEFAIGLLSLVFQPEDHREWEDIWAGKSAVDLDERLAALAPAFNLTGDAEGKGAHFLQDFDPLAGEANDVEALFIDTPGINGQKKNADLLTHRGRFPALGLKAAAIALYTLQQFAPSGGAGNRTSLRGGGPMTTLIRPDRANSHEPTPLWRLLLANLPLTASGETYLLDEDLPRALPWLAPTITSDGKPPAEISQTDPRAHALQSFFGMPRRIRLIVGEAGVCPMTGETGPLVTGFVQKPWGINYGAWQHPLTPYRQTKDEAPYTVKPKSSRFGYRDWTGVVIGRADKSNSAYPAQPVAALGARSGIFRRDGYSTARLIAAGWAMNNMEAGSYLYAVQPLHLAESAEKARDLAAVATAMAEAGDAAAGLMRSNLKLALFGDGAKTATDSGLFEEATDAFFERTDTDFHATLGAVAVGEAGDDQALRKDWLRHIRRTALDLFDLHATAVLVATSDAKAAERVTDAYRRLRGALGEAGKIAAALGIEQPLKAEKPKKTGRIVEGASV